MKKITLVVMAAGIGSRYGGVKQLEPVGTSGEIILDYSVYDAIKAGFKKVIFIIRKDIEEDFKEIIGDRLAKYVEVEYVIQELNDLPKGYTQPAERTKPWGTGQAVLCCKELIHEPFAVINADDYYGKEAFVRIKEFLENPGSSDKKYNFCMAGFRLGNTLSEHGTVTRGVCKVNEKNILIDIEETKNIEKKKDHAEANGFKIPFEQPVSMNMWGFTPEFMDELEVRFQQFLEEIRAGEKDSCNSEYLLPIIIGDMIKEDIVQVSVLDTQDKWFGVTYKEDKEYVVKAFRKLVEEGAYPKQLFEGK
ncbi:nucleotidyltransferase family protein [Velocimicrobium porci]|uniref:Nucleotidyltransferase n=1 Tax=Velocimicrobium porci TaxID=2606634 RepID=A0A6L5Y1D2_9FIRM|nr:sugar phosphate nucleotidyltransferase [Velocimicrobium porci]MSS64218.1 nucleotidyltransferase [Velocimicrobium porci]